MRRILNRITDVGMGIYFIYILTMMVINFSLPEFSFKLHSMLGLTMINDILLNPAMICFQILAIIIFTGILWKEPFSERLLMYKYTIGVTSLVAIFVTFLNLGMGVAKGFKTEYLNKDVYAQLIEYNKENKSINGTTEIHLPSKENKLRVIYSSMFNKMYILGAEQEIESIELSTIEREILIQTKVEDEKPSFLY